jgi:hypothetical protein
LNESFIETHFAAPVRQRANLARLVRLAVAHLGRALKSGGRRGAGDPGELGGCERRAQQRRMIVSLHDHEHVALQVLVCDVPRRFGRITTPADAQALALAERVIHEPAVLPEPAAGAVLDIAGLRGQELRQELREGPFADEADAGAVFLVEDRQHQLARPAPDFLLAQAADREQRPRECVGRHGVQEVALVLAGVDTAQQARALAVLDTRVVPRRHPIRAQATRIVEADAELDLAIAEHVRVRRTTGAVFLEEIREDALAILAGETDLVQRDSELLAHPACVLVVLGRRTVAVFVLVPVAHEQALHLVALLQEQPGGDGRVDAAGHADDD